MMTPGAIISIDDDDDDDNDDDDDDDDDDNNNDDNCELTLLILVWSFRDKLKVANEELQKKKAYIDSLEPKVNSSGK